MPTTVANTKTQFTIDFSNCNCSQSGGGSEPFANTIIKFTIDFSNCICGGSEPGGSEPFEVKFEQNKKGILVKIKNLTSNTLDLVIQAYISVKRKYLLKDTLVQPSEDSFVFFPVDSVSDVIFAIYEKSNDCTLAFNEETKSVIFHTTNQNVVGLCVIYDDNNSYSTILQVPHSEAPAPSELHLYDMDSILNVHCFCVKREI